ncbi:SET and MYND domain-containing protein 4 [Bicyclus anynana]|uniref:SET and MYND domain-containing protein 4 n=1 Tax=Bicyclus anynana TaxID=110368 RepID=A0A6J1N7F2_BICAN|nr:SET and MYND domain-containing protein 4 [Bicyclus anynana]
MPRVYEDFDPKYASICSDVTVYSNNKGFFKSLAEEIVSLAEVDGWMQTFEDVEDDKKVTTVLENNTIMNALNEVLSRIQPMFRGKDARISYERRMAAQTCLKDGDLTKSLALASQAVLRAPMTGTEEIIDAGVSLALALWLRSEILLRFNRPEAALEDLKIALKERLPARMRSEYYWRMGHCYKGAGEPTRAKVSYELAGRLLGNNEQAKAQLAKDIESLDYTSTPKHHHKPEVYVTGGAKLNLPSLSKKVKVIEEKDKGRFAIADENVKVGDILLVDRPYAACLLSEYYGSHCLHCFQRLENCDDGAPVWCPNCSGVAFCTTKCRDAAVSTYHAYECQFLDLFIGSGMSMLSHISLRMVTQAGYETSQQIYAKYLSNEIKTVESSVLNDIEGVTKKNKLKSRKERLNRTKKGLKSFEEKNSNDDAIETKPEDKASYNEMLELTAAQIYSLCSHSQQRKGADYLKRIIMGMFLTQCLKISGYFKTCSEDNMTKAEKNTCELLVRNLQLLQFNAHEIYETVRGNHQFSGSKPVYTAVGIYPTGALFNHECYPAVARYFDRQNIILRAIRPLRPGEVVSENYGPHFLMRGLKERQRMLASRYWFCCDCTACKENWPTLKQMDAEPTLYLRCPNDKCHGKFRQGKNIANRCPRCSIKIDKELFKDHIDSINECLSQYKDGAKAMEHEHPQEAIQILSNAVDSFYKMAQPPHRETHIAQESLRSCFATEGNVYIVKTEQKEK